MTRTMIATLALAVPMTCAADEVATYELVWDAFWSADTHPGAYPGNGHFASIHATAHNEAAVFWAPGELASPGIEQMAEQGGGGFFELEVIEQVNAGNALGYFKRAGTTAQEMPIIKTHELDVTSTFSQLTAVTMIAPSPDWFIGVNGLELRPDGEWIESITLMMDPWDSGTDSGANFGSPNEDTDPPEPISSLVGVFPFFDLGPISSWTFNLVSVVDPCPADCDGSGAIDVLDFVCFQMAWQQQTEVGDCNGDGVYDILDFVCFQGEFAQGCE